MSEHENVRPPFEMVADRRFIFACAVMAVTIGLISRGPRFMGLDFPLNDGGLFLAFIEGILANGFALPEFVDFNRYEIPFGYPPLSFYLAAAISKVTGAAPIDVVLYLPVVFNLASIALFVFVAAAVVPNRSTLLFTAFIFPLIPRSYEWTIMGGGVSRSPGMFLALLSLLFAMAAMRSDARKWWVATTFALGATLATHLEWGITAWVAVCVFLLSVRPTRETVLVLIGLGMGMGVVSMPWWGTVIVHHGIDPFLAAATTGGWKEVTFANRLVHFDLFTLPGSWLALVGAAGLVFELNRKRYLVVVWLLLIFVTTPRHGQTVATMPVAMLVGIALSMFADRVAASVANFAARFGEDSSAESGVGVERIRIAQLIVTGLICVVAMSYMSYETNERQEFSPLASLTEEERAGMQWIRDNMELESHFLVVSTARAWEADRAAEWFPILAERRSVNTVQGLEWVLDAAFVDQGERGDMHRQASFVSPTLAPDLGIQLFGPWHTHVAVFAKTGHPLHISYSRSDRYQTVAIEKGYSIFRLRSPEVAKTSPM